MALHRLVARQVRRDPALFDGVQQTLNRQYEQWDPSSLPYVVAWQKLVDLGMEAALAAAIDETERGQVLRRSAPFCGIFSEPERLNFLRSRSRAKGPG